MKKQLLPILIAALSLGLAACGNGGSSSTTPSSEQTSSEAGGSSQSQSQSQTSSEAAATLVSIAVSGDYQKSYYKGDGYNPDGLVVTATYDNQTTKVIDEDAYEVTGFDSTTTGEKTLTVSYQGKTATFKVTVTDVPKVTVSFSVTVNGIDAYADEHQKIYLSTEMGGSATSWKTYEMSQSTENQNVWTVSVEDIEIDQAYEYTYWYGGETTQDVDWTYGHETDSEGAKLANRSLLVKENAHAATDVAYFVVPVLEDKIVTLTVTPKVQTTADGTATPIENNNLFLYAYNSADRDTVAFTNNGDGTYSKQLTVKVNSVDKSGELTFKGTLSLVDRADWNFQSGIWENNVFNSWDNYLALNKDTGDEVEADLIFIDEPVAHTVALTLTPKLQPTATDTPVAINEGLNLFVWSYAEVGNVKFDYDSENKNYKHTYTTAAIGKNSHSGVLEFGANLSTTEEPNWSYESGEYVDGKFVKNHKVEIDNDTNAVACPVYFQDQPEVVVNPYKLTINATFADSSNISYVSAHTEGNDWVTLNKVDESNVYSGEYDGGNSNNVVFNFEVGLTNGKKMNVIKSSNLFQGYDVTIVDRDIKGEININIPAISSDDAAWSKYEGEVSSVSNCQHNTYKATFNIDFTNQLGSDWLAIVVKSKDGTWDETFIWPQWVEGNNYTVTTDLLPYEESYFAVAACQPDTSRSLGVKEIDGTNVTFFKITLNGGGAEDTGIIDIVIPEYTAGTNFVIPEVNIDTTNCSVE